MARDVDLTKIGGDGTCWYSVANLADSHHVGGAGLCDEDAQYIAALDPEKRVRELEGRKRILQRHAPWPMLGRTICGQCVEWDEDGHRGGRVTFPCPDWRDAAGQENPNV